MKRQSPTAGFGEGSNAAMKDQSVEASMLIHRPPGEVFAAFVNPQPLRKFWLSDASGPLAPGARVQWSSWCRAPRPRWPSPGSRRRATWRSTGTTRCTST